MRRAHLRHDPTTAAHPDRHPHTHQPTVPPSGPPRARRLSLALADNRALPHPVDYQAAGRGDLGKPQGYVARQVTGWINRYGNARTDDVPAMDRAGRWLSEHMPAESGAALIHND